MSRPLGPLTDRQKAVLEFIKKFGLRYGYPPTLREICIGFKWTSLNAARDVLVALERKGEIARTPGISRGIRLLHAV